MRISIFVMVVGLLALSAPAQKPGGQGGEATFQQQCAGCHGQDGRAQTDMGKAMQAADLTSSGIQKHSDSDLAKSVKDGKGKMPAVGDKLSDDDIKAVLAYVRQFGKK